MKNKITLGVVAASFTALSMLSGCSAYGTAESTDSNETISFSITAVDGYVIKTVDPITMTCGQTVYTANDTIGASGKVTFPALATAPTADCLINIPAATIIDNDNDGIYDAAKDTSLGFAIKASGDDSVVSQLTTQVLDLVDANEPAKAAALKALVKDFNPVAATTTAATNSQTANLVILGEALKTMKKTGASAVEMVKVDTSVVTSATAGSIIDVQTLLTDIDPTIKSAVVKTTNVMVDLIADVTAIVAANPTVDITKLFVAVSDGGETATEALTAATTEAIDLTGTAITTIDNKIDAAKAEVALLPAYLTLGTTMNLGDLNVTLSDTGTFAAEVDVNTASTLTDFSKITLPSVTLSKGFSTQSFYLTTTITNKADSGDTVVAMLGDANDPLQLDASDDNQSVKVTIPLGTPMTVNTSVNGVTDTYGPIGTSDVKVNEDLSFDVCGVIDCENSAISALNNHLQVAGKSYDVNITLVPTDSTNFDANLTLDYFSVTGVITTK